jgi:hypothetical protein
MERREIRESRVVRAIMTSLGFLVALLRSVDVIFRRSSGVA